MAIKTNKKGEIFNEINITPLTDIFLVLLIIMMVIAPMFQSIDQNINLPKINNGLSVDTDKVTVAITEKGVFYVDSAPISSDSLDSKLSEKFEALKAKQQADLKNANQDVMTEEQKKSAMEKTIVVKADAKTKNKEIMKVMRAAKMVGFEKLIVTGEPLSKSQQKDLESKNNELEQE